MEANNPNTSQSVTVEPFATSCYGNGWQKLWPNFLTVLLITIIPMLLSFPASFVSMAEEFGPAFGIFASIFTITYSVLLINPLEYGASYAYLRVARGDKAVVQDMFTVFQTYGNAVLANILVGAIVVFGIILLIIPGIIFACKLAFVPYLVVEQKLDAIEAISKSWRMTKGHAFTVFLIWLIALPIIIAGFICCFVGVIISAMWVALASASLYHAVRSEEKASEVSYVDVK